MNTVINHLPTGAGFCPSALSAQVQEKLETNRHQQLCERLQGERFLDPLLVEQVNRWGPFEKETTRTEGGLLCASFGTSHFGGSTG